MNFLKYNCCQLKATQTYCQTLQLANRNSGKWKMENIR